ncbi:MAG: hypothetical protein JJU24_14045 [Natronohydrobacter sp.]|nr:hypothetical protein [Natronohydrobacter sp.]
MLAALGFGVVSGASAETPLMTWETHGSLRITNPADGRAVIVDDCWMDSSETGVFPMPRPVGENLFVASCRQSDGRARVHIFQASDLSVLSGSEPAEALHLRLLPQGLMISHDTESTIWEAHDNHFGSDDYLQANAIASGLTYRPGQPLWPRLHSAHFRVALDPKTPLRLGPTDDAPYFERLRGYLLIHLGDGNEDSFWQIGDHIRLCIPDGGCGYAHKSAVLPVHDRDDDPFAVKIMTQVLGPRDPDLACWTQVVDDAVDDAFRCYRVIDVLDIGGRQPGVLVVASGVESLYDGAVMRCAACQVSLLVAFAPDKMTDKVAVSDAILMGAWGEGPTLTDLELDIPDDSVPWQLHVAEVYNDRGTVMARGHLFRPTNTGIEHRMTTITPRERHTVQAPGILRVDSLVD